KAHITDLTETAQRLNQGQDLHDTLGSLAKDHQAQEDTDQAEVVKSLKDQHQAIQGSGSASDGNFPELTAPHLVMASPAGIESTTPKSTHQHSGEHHAISASGHASVVAGKSWLVSAMDSVRMFAYKTGIKLVAAGANIEVSALEKNIQLLAKLEITQTANKITISAKEEIVINGGGSNTKWSAGNIEYATSGTWVTHAASHSMPGPANVPVPELPAVTPSNERLVFNLMTQPASAAGRLQVGEPYELYKNGALIAKDVTNERGQVIVKNHQANTNAYQVKLSNGSTFELKVSDALSDEQEHQLSNQGYRANAHIKNRADGHGLS
uniref:DUF2345 domain-containing protein n=1 Tax=Uliginosibacterium gangwonense TaxID=392736 RepID=UPI00036FF6B0